MAAEIKPVHSSLGASSYYRWKACPGSIRQTAGLKGQESAYAARGTTAHDIASKILMKQPWNWGDFDEEEIEAVTTYTDFVQDLAETKGVKLFVEQRFDLSKYYPNLYGTADAVIYHAEMRKLVVIDYKHGAGIPVEVTENSQLMYYGLGALHMLGKPVDSIELVIVQPRCFHSDGPIRRWTTTPARMMEFIADLIDDAKLTEDKNAVLNPGDWCRFCPAQAMHCPAVREKSLALAKNEFSSLESYDPKKLSETLDMLPTIEAWIKAVREFSYREAEHGRIPPGWKLVAKRANRKWAKEYKSDELARDFGLRPPDVTTVTLKSPAQVEKLIPKSTPALFDRLNAMVVQESSGKSLVPESDPRPAVTVSARDVFEVIS